MLRREPDVQESGTIMLGDWSSVPSPSLVICAATMRRNLASMIRLAGDPARLRPHCKTHKMREPIRELLALGVTKHKCATPAEAEMLAECGATDILLAYQPVGPNVGRMIDLARRYPTINLTCTFDHIAPLRTFAAAAHAANVTIGAMLDLDVGMHRTGIAPGSDAFELYREIARLSGVRPAGVQTYDGHTHHTDFAERAAAVKAIWCEARAFIETLIVAGLPVPRIVAGGTPSFPIFAAMHDPLLELSPGTPVLYDAGYAAKYTDLPFETAAFLLTRVIGRPAANRLTLDLGHKAIAPDPPAGKRLVIPAIPDGLAVMHSEEHLVIETAEAAKFHHGDIVWAIPTHVCPTCALHKVAYVREADGSLHQWLIASRDRV